MLSHFRAFCRDDRGVFPVLLAVAFPALLGVVGGAVDYAAMNRSHSQLQNAADSAALAIARQMTVGPVTSAQIPALATAHVLANLGAESGATATGQLEENGLAIRIRASIPAKSPLGIIPQFLGSETLDVASLARVTASSAPSKLCILSLGNKLDGGIFMHNNSVISAPECVMHSNSTNRNAVIVQYGSKIQSTLVCARGGISNLSGTLQTTLVTDCPEMRDPIATRPEPSSGSACNHTKYVIGETKVDSGSSKAGKGSAKVAASVESAAVTLNPGIYCNGLTIGGSARVTLNPGVYIIKDGPMIVRGNAEFIGKGVTFLFTGKKSYFRFLDNALVQISAPTGGVSAGMLLWESRNFVVGNSSWQRGGCETEVDDDDDDDVGPSCPGRSSRSAGNVPIKKANEHHINSDRARELTGTIYLPNGLLLVDSRRPIADQSPFTVLVAQKVDLFDGPNLVLNANYNGSPVPVPAGLGVIGAKEVRLGQ
jgi:hypothetical protein